MDFVVALLVWLYANVLGNIVASIITGLALIFWGRTHLRDHLQAMRDHRAEMADHRKAMEDHRRALEETSR